MRDGHRWIYALLVATACGAHSQVRQPLPGSDAGRAVPARMELPNAEYRLHLSDSLEIQLPFSSEYNEAVIVQPDGRISLRDVAPVQVEGKTVVEAETVIAAAYSGILNKPRVSIVLKDFFRPSFYANGEVGRPGRYEIRSEITLLQAISEAGGLLNERARKREIVILRPQGNGTYESKVMDVKRVLSAKGPEEDYRIRAGDIIYVPQNRMSKLQRYIPTPSVGTYATPF